ncbi:MAG: PRC-barrel domain-containing protein [Candidatus Bathyarchaeia archaeon]
MSEPHKYMPSQKIIGMQIVDSKGAIIGNVKDLAVSIGSKEVFLIVGTKAGDEIEVPWRDVGSIEDVIPLSRPEGRVEEKTSPPPLQTVTCNSCGATLPAHAKFCAKCGSRVK